MAVSIDRCLVAVSIDWCLVRAVGRVGVWVTVRVLVLREGVMGVVWDYVCS